MDQMLKSVELFSGCGGLALGLSRSGFEHNLLVEFDENAVATLVHNKTRKLDHICDWPIVHDDVRRVDWSDFAGADLVAGGPPCQPFSIGGKAAGSSDKRDMWPAVFSAIEQVQPRAFVFENVRGLARPRFSDYLKRIVDHLSKPAVNLVYGVQVQLVNAADFGAAQKRNRVLVMGVRGVGAEELPTPMPTHSRERLVWDQWISGEYWEEHGISRSLNNVPKADAALVSRLKKSMAKPRELRWVTVRDRLRGLGPPNEANNHIFQPGAKVYPGHTGSPLDQPAKALKAGDHGVPGGENMMVKDDGSVRYFTLRECARLQGFPDDYQFPRSWTESMRQLGNAVPVELAQVVGEWASGMLLPSSDEFDVAA